MTLETNLIKNILEEKEINNLSPYAAKSKFSKGRKVEEKPCSIRTEFQRDRDRILHSKAFRRLKHKTQVFFAPNDDHYRTRLTHTLEVAQVSRTIAKALNLNEDLVEAIALGHDVGHTPFGHSGESVLDNIMTNGFNHNENSVRVVSVIEDLNLTDETLNGILCHSYAWEPAYTLEGQIVQIADKIAYINHDIDDSLRAGIIRIEDMPKDCIQYFSPRRQERFSKMVYNLVENSMDKNKIEMDEECMGYMNKLRSWMFENVYLNSVAKAEEDKAKHIIRELFEHYMNLIQIYAINYDEIKAQQTVCDYISGMTDTYIVQKYNQNFIPKSLARFDDDDFLFRFAKLNGLTNVNE